MEDTFDNRHGCIEYPYPPEENKSSPKKFVWFFFGILVVVIGLGLYVVSAPSDFPTKSFLHIVPGEALITVEKDAQNVHIVRNARLLQLLVELYGNTRHIAIGDYYFDAPVSAITVAQRLATGNFNVVQTKITIPEGFNHTEIGLLFGQKFANVNTSDFISQTKTDEGFLFPDTYFFSPGSTTDDIIARLKSDYEAHVAPLRPNIAASGMSEHDVITLASILEKEAHGDDDRSIIAGILEKRLSIGMALQTDATVAYALGKTNESLTPSDLKAETPYNTYLHPGLPPGPNGNPGMAAILAVLHPTKTNYLYYLHDANGVAHYAVTFAEHKQNIAKYLK
jgi:UPF0755 protein